MQPPRPSLRTRLAAGSSTRGGWCSLGHPPAAMLLARAGFDWICLDAQHGLYRDSTLVETLGRLQALDTDVLVRVGSNDTAAIGRALDLGATGVIVPMVEDETQAALAAAACRYPPAGQRSWGPLSRLYGAPVPAAEPANREVLCAVMVETPRGLSNVEDIAAVDGVDIVFLGPYDLALASGVPLDALLSDVSPSAALPRVVAACAAAGRTPGAYAGSPELTRTFDTIGYRMTAVADDTTLLAEAAAKAAGSVPAVSGS